MPRHRERVDKVTDERRKYLSIPRYLSSEQFELDLQSYFSGSKDAKEIVKSVSKFNVGVRRRCCRWIFSTPQEVRARPY
jgi:hypothetical protein